MINREILRAVIQEQQGINLPQPVITRHLPFDIKKLRESDSIVIVTGVRCCGKSTWLQQLRLSQLQNFC